MWSTTLPPPVVSVATHGCAGALELLRNTDGGTMFVPSGVHTCGPFNLTSNLFIYLAAGAVLKAEPSADAAKWPLLAPLSIYGTGHDDPGPRFSPFVGGFDVSNVTIGGENGTIDGSGAFWWAIADAGLERYTRPSLFECVRCTDLTLQDVTFRNSGFWTVHPVLSRRVTARRITVLNPHPSPNSGPPRTA
jgi:polygalacturonase